MRFVVITDKRKYDVTAGFVVGSTVLLVALVALVGWVIKLPG
jgi:hypothetical protein